MKQRYITPTIITIIVRNPLLQTASQKNEYGSAQGVDYGRIRFSRQEVDPSDSD